MCERERFSEKFHFLIWQHVLYPPGMLETSATIVLADDSGYPSLNCCTKCAQLHIREALADFPDD